MMLGPPHAMSAQTKSPLELLHEKIDAHGIEALTPSERRIADMAAQGLSNRDIAQALFLSVRTIENQLRRVYGKLDIGSRHELAAALES